MHHTWSVICSDTSIDAESKNISLFNIVESVTFSVDEDEATTVQEELGYLPLPLNIVVVTMWWRSDINKSEKGHSRLLLITPSGKERSLTETPVDLTNHTRTRIIGRIQGFPFFENGIYQILVQSKENEEWFTVAKIPLEINQRKDD